ncbi:hypothetical protein SprV_0902783800 [Sparganum proliferum]
MVLPSVLTSLPNAVLDFEWPMSARVIAIVSVVVCIICLILLFSVFQYANVQSMQDLFNDYGKDSDTGRISGIIWNFTMATSGICCGMDGARDFANQSTVPSYCCETQNDCPVDEAVYSNVTGCRGKIQSDGLAQMINIMPIFLLLMVAQAGFEIGFRDHSPGDVSQMRSPLSVIEILPVIWFWALFVIWIFHFSLTKPSKMV